VRVHALPRPAFGQGSRITEAQLNTLGGIRFRPMELFLRERVYV
jgi:hypothetical protein